MKILAFGEILWDIFGTEKKIGGAPFNFSAHCSKLGAHVDYITSVGKDELGSEALKYIDKYGVSTEFVSFSNLVTGCCNVTLKNGIPDYDLIYPTAYDDVSVPDNVIEKFRENKYDYLYCGTLALRGEKSRKTFFDICDRIDSKLILDVNIRQNYYCSALLEELFSRAEIVKISREELPAVAVSLNLSSDSDLFVSSVFKKYENIKKILLTLDKDGAVCCLASGKKIVSVKPESKVVSTVGAGDSFTAAYLVYSLKGFSDKDALDKAVELSDYVVRFKEAIPD